MERRSRRRLAVLSLGIGGLAIAVIALARSGPRPRVRLVRAVMDLGGDLAGRALAAHVPPGIDERLDLPYDPPDPDGRFDLFRPSAADGPLATVVWIHGGAWVSGRKEHVANYLRILAAEGFTTVGVEYTTAPAATYPTPLRQVGRALAHLAANAADLGIDPDRVVLAGDSAGAQIASQVAIGLTNPAYAERIGVDLPVTALRPRGVVLHCGAYDFGAFDPRSPIHRFVRDVLSSYFGAAEPATAIAEEIGPAFPTTFISVGDADPMRPHSIELADALEAAGVTVERLFFEGPDAAGLGHEYQFDLDRPPGRLALARTVAFIRTVTGA